ncbi:MAG: patatin-like phospholipase family protein [Mycobacterium sp.]
MVATKKPVDLVLSGGGVRYVGLVGAIVALMDSGYSAYRMAATSSGSVVGSIMAAASKGDQLTGEQIKELAVTVPLRKWRDKGSFGHVPVVGRAWGVLRDAGVYRGDFAHDWICSQLTNLGVTTFGDLAVDDDHLLPERRYKLVVTAADVTRGQLVRLPWDYRRIYGLDPDEQSVADAVRASMAIPFYFRPVDLTSSTGRTCTLVDGGVLSSFPIDALDRPDRQPPRWPTFGITLTSKPPESHDVVIPGLHPLRFLRSPSLLEGLITTILVGHDQTHLDQPWISARTIRVDTTGVSALEFGMSREQAEALYGKGYAAAQAFLSSWDWPAYLGQFRPPG